MLMFHDDKNPLEPEYTPFSQTQEERFNGFYETGNTRPPKNHGGWVAAALLACIFFGGLTGGAVLMNLNPAVPPQETEDVPQQADPTTPAATQPSESTEPEPQILEATGAQDDDTELLISETPEAVANPLQSGGLSLQEIYRKVSPSVVSITATQADGSSYGSGIVMSQSGYIITNCHVVDDAYHLTVTLSDERVYDAQLVGKDSASDLAVLHIDGENLTAAEFGDSSQAQVGDAVAAIGDPLGIELRGTMTEGIISAINRNLTIQGRTLTLIQTTAALNEGNSGGPLINCYGQVIGINTMKMSSYSSTSATVEGLGFAIPITAAKPILDELIQQGYVSGRPAIGIQGETLGISTQLFFHMPSGVVITAVEETSDAAAKGLQPDDVIVGLNDSAIDSLEDLVAAKNDLSAGDQVTLTIYRGGRYYEVTVTLMDQISAELY